MGGLRRRFRCCGSVVYESKLPSPQISSPPYSTHSDKATSVQNSPVVLDLPPRHSAHSDKATLRLGDCLTDRLDSRPMAPISSLIKNKADKREACQPCGYLFGLSEPTFLATLPHFRWRKLNHRNFLLVDDVDTARRHINHHFASGFHQYAFHNLTASAVNHHRRVVV